MKPEQIAALAAAGYSKAEIEGMTAKPATLESLAAEITELKTALNAKYGKAIQNAEQPPAPTAEDILAGITAPTETEVK